ncbi:hypothetical protein TBS_28650 [Thermobispora bispora]|nr:hypothetical protein CYL17_03950 [Thermobispora bispora]
MATWENREAIGEVIEAAVTLIRRLAALWPGEKERPAPGAHGTRRPPCLGAYGERGIRAVEFRRRHLSGADAVRVADPRKGTEDPRRGDVNAVRVTGIGAGRARRRRTPAHHPQGTAGGPYPACRRDGLW